MATQMDPYGQPVEDPNKPKVAKPVTAAPSAPSQVPLAAPAQSPTPQPSSIPLATGGSTPQSTASGNIPLAAPSQPYATTTSNVGPGSTANYLGTTIQPGPATDRLALAKSNFETYSKATDPAYQKSLRDATAKAAGVGQLGSGQLRTSYGDLAANRALQLDTQKQNFLDEATKGAIEDAYKNVGIAQQQQGFQAQQQAAAEAQRIASGGLTLAERQADTGNKLAEGALTGSYDGTQTLAAKQGADSQALAREQLELAKTGQGQSYELAKSAQDLQRQVQTGQLSIAQANQKLQEMVSTGQLSIEQARQALAELQNAQGVEQFSKTFEAGQQQSAFGQALQQAQLEEALTSGSYGRALSSLGAGMLGNPADIAMQLAGLYGGQATAAGQGAGSLLGNAAIANAVGGGGGGDTGTDWLSQLYGWLGGGGGGNTPTIPTATPTTTLPFALPDYGFDPKSGDIGTEVYY